MDKSISYSNKRISSTKACKFKKITEEKNSTNTKFKKIIRRKIIP